MFVSLVNYSPLPVKKLTADFTFPLNILLSAYSRYTGKTDRAHEIKIFHAEETQNNWSIN